MAQITFDAVNVIGRLHNGHYEHTKSISYTIPGLKAMLELMGVIAGEVWVRVLRCLGWVHS